MKKDFEIVGCINNQVVDSILAGNGKAALNRFQQGLLSTGFREIHRSKAGLWMLSTSYGTYFVARERRNA